MQLEIVVLLALVPVLTGLAGFLAVPRVVRHMPPALASVLLTVLALTVSLMTGLMLCLAALFGVIRVLPAIRPHDWSAHTLDARIPIPAAVGVAAGALAVVLLVRAAVHLVRVATSMRRTAAVAADLPVVNGLAIVDDPTLHAYAVPGRRRLVVVSTGMLQELSGPQRRALLAHEDAHLRHHHHLYAQLARLAAAANPLMRPVARAVASSLERWADADAVREVGDPAVVAHALGTVALASHATVPSFALGATQDDVVERVRDLLEPPTRPRRGGLVLALVTMLCWASSAIVFLYVRGAVEIAEAVRH